MGQKDGYIFYNDEKTSNSKIDIEKVSKKRKEEKVGLLSTLYLSSKRRANRRLSGLSGVRRKK